MTFSLAVYSPKTKQIGLAQASCGLFTGTTCPLICPSGRFIGTIQAFVNRSIKADILQILALSGSVQSLDAELRANDPFYEYRQLAIIGFDGQAFGHTGKNASPVAGHLLGDNFVVAGNMLTEISCLDAMVEDFVNSESAPFGERLVSALEAGKKAGGQSAAGRKLRERAACVMVYDEAGACHLNLRIDMSSDAIKALRELWSAYRVYDHFMEVCEKSPESLVSLDEQDRMVPHAPSIFEEISDSDSDTD